MTFDKLAFVRKLEQVSIPRNQAEAMSEAFHDDLAESVATKSDVTAVSAEVGALRSEMKTEFAAVRAEAKAEAQSTKAEFADIRAEIRAAAQSTKPSSRPLERR